MKKILFLTKTLLAAALLCVGQNAWGDIDYNYELVNQNFSDVTGEAAKWTTGGSGPTMGQTLRSGSDYYWTINHNSGNSAATAYYTLPDFSSYEAFKISFLWGMYSPSANNRYNLFKIVGASGDFATTGNVAGYSSSVTLTAGETATTLDIDAYSTSTRGNANRTTNLYKITIEGISAAADAVNNGVYLTITTEDGGTTKLARTKISDYQVITRLHFESGQFYGQNAIDDLLVQAYTSVEVVPNPSATITGVDGANRTVTMNLGGGSSDGTVIKYYTDTESKSDLTTYTEPFVVSSTSKIYYYAESTSGATSDEQSIDVTCVAVKLNAPSILRTGANTYTITPTTTTTDGITAAQTIHYTIGGGSEQTGTSLTGVDGDIVAWATATGFTKSDNVNMTYVAPIAIGDVKWTYNLNNYPSAHNCTAIANAIDEDKTITIDDVTYYNLKDESYPDLYISNGAAWLLRNQAGSAWKAQNNDADGKIVIANVKTTDVIYFKVVLDGGKTYGVTATNATLKYSYNNQEYFYVPNADGNVILTMPKAAGMSIYDVKVSSTVVSKTITAAGYATFCSPYALNFEGVSGLKAYIVKGTVGETTELNIEEVTSVPANEGVLLEGDAGEYNIPVVASSATDVSSNKLVGKTAEYELAAEAGYVLMGSPKVGFYKNAKVFTVGANTAYLPASFASGARSAYFFRGDITGVDNVEAAAEAKAKDGKFIENGKIVIVKNGVKYNAAGQQVK